MAIKTLLSLADLPERIVAGVISGTSVDAIKVAICKIKGAGVRTKSSKGTEISLIHLYSHPYTPDLKRRLYKSLELTTQEISTLHIEVGEIFAEAVLKTLVRANLNVEDLNLIGSHGQTIFHHSGIDGVRASSFQIGDGDVIAEVTGVAVVSDFRARDIAAGGEGAPLTPYADAILYPYSKDSRKIILNLGGVGNITILNEDPFKITGFDTGPANGPLDRLVRRITNSSQAQDTEGKIALSGKVNAELLEALLKEDKYTKRVPPKSTGFEMYGDKFVDELIKRHGSCDADLLATVTAFVGRTIGDAVKNFIPFKVDEMIVAGGGANNPVLMEEIKRSVSPVKVIRSDDAGVLVAAREAMAFAIFANDFIFGLPTNIPTVTGARNPRTLGKLSLPSLP